MGSGFSIRVAASATGLSERQIRRLCAGDVITPSVQPPSGRGSVTRFSYFDLLRLKVAECLQVSGGITSDRLALAIGELRKVRDGSWGGCLLYTRDWETFDICRDARTLAGELLGRPLTVVISLDAVDGELRSALAGLSLAAPVAA